ncbi:methyltransferase, FxLD system [Streptomyces sp. NPDC005195]|uniref:methyltransferase, FxLD system n=1 Tax=Streptomyces sp. NPDC005195 TaxID=3154561 RepID=UPI0033B533DC
MPPIDDTADTADTDGTNALRHQLTDRLTAAGHIRTAAVEHAFRTVPRHAFAPEVPVVSAYADDIVATRHTDAGRVTSSVSAPWLQADMLEAARIEPGDRVLEIGSGGYNAALIAELVGSAGSVTTVDIDPAVTDRATRFLTDTGYDRVRVVTADAEHLPSDITPDEGFDAIIVTVGSWDLPWIGAFAEGGRLVAPLRLHQYTWAMGFTKRDGALHSEEPLIVCGFVAMRGAGAWKSTRRTVPGTGVHLVWEDGTPLPVDRLAPVLTREPSVVHTHVTVGGQEPFDALALFLAGALPGFCRLVVDPGGDRWVLNPPPRHWPGVAIVRGASLACLATERVHDGEDGGGVYELVVHGYGPTGRLAAQEMAEQVRRWQRNHRAALCPRITIEPVTGGAAVASPARDPHVFIKRHTRVAIDWPVVAGTAALLTDGEGRYLLHLRSATKPIWRPGQWARERTRRLRGRLVTRARRRPPRPRRRDPAYPVLLRRVPMERRARRPSAGPVHRVALVAAQRAARTDRGLRQSRLGGDPRGHALHHDGLDLTPLRPLPLRAAVLGKDLPCACSPRKTNGTAATPTVGVSADSVTASGRCWPRTRLRRPMAGPSTSAAESVNSQPTCPRWATPWTPSTGRKPP